MRERRDRLRRLDVSAMTPERLQHIKDQYERWGEAALERACSELIDHIDALTAEPSRVEDTEVAEVINALLQPGEYGSEPPTFDVKVANLLSRIAAAKASAEADRDAEKAGAETLDIAAMDANDKLGKLAALVIDMQVASPYGQKVKAYARYCMNSGPDPLREAYPHEQEGSISAPLIARAETAEAKLRDARGLAEAARVIVNSTSKLNRHGIPDTDMETIQLGKIRALSRALSNPE